MRSVIFSLVGVVVGLTTMWVATRPAADSPEPTPLPRSERSPGSQTQAKPRADGALTELQRRQHGLESDVDELWNAVGELENGQAGEEWSPEEEEAKAIAEEAQLIVALSERVAAGPKDAQWANAAVSTIEGWGAAYHGAQVQDAQCGEDVCSFTLRYPDVESERIGMNQIAGFGPWSAEGFARRVSETEPVYQVFLAREGQPLAPGGV